jgi:hypothetical protein
LRALPFVLDEVAASGRGGMTLVRGIGGALVALARGGVGAVDGAIGGVTALPPGALTRVVAATLAAAMGGSGLASGSAFGGVLPGAVNGSPVPIGRRGRKPSGRGMIESRRLGGAASVPAAFGLATVGLALPPPGLAESASTGGAPFALSCSSAGLGAACDGVPAGASVLDDECTRSFPLIL